MAYSTITDTEIQPGKPGSNQLFTKLRDNPEAIAAGLSGAPRIVKNALASDSVDFATKIDDTKDTGTLDGSALTYQIVPKGVVNLSYNTGALRLEFFVGGAWTFSLTIGNQSGQFVSTQVISDGANVRVGGFNGSNICNYHRIFK